MTPLFPWHTDVFRAWHALPKHAHAYLVIAPDDTGGENLLSHLATSVLCESPLPSHEACSVCASCQLIAASSHPDHRIIRPSMLDINHPIEELRPEKPSKEIGIGQVRELANMVNQTSHRGGMRVVQVYPAHKLNTNAANALLKTLEEPPEHTLFLLLAHDVKQILPTIVSRCQRINAPAPSVNIAVDYLNQHSANQPNWAEQVMTENGAVLRVAELHNSNYFTLQNQFAQELSHGKQVNFLKLAEQFDKYIKDADKARLAGEPHTVDMSTLIMWLQRWLHDLLTVTQNAGQARYYPTHAAALQKLAANTNPIKLHDWQLQLLKEQRSSEHPLSVRTWLEKLFLQYTQVV